MKPTTKLHLFDIQAIMNDIEKVIEKGLNKLLVNYIERHELLEKTHQQLIQLPSIAEELNRRNRKDWINDSDFDTEENDCSNFTSIKDMTENIVRDQVSSLENKLNKMEKKYDAIIPILDKLLGKITHLNDDIKELQNNRTPIQEVVYTNTIEKSSVVKSCENENIEIHIEESEELEEEEISDDEDVNPALITCSVISLKQEEKISEEEQQEEEEEKESKEDEEDEEEEELGIEEIKVEEKNVEVKEERPEEDEESKEEQQEEKQKEEQEEEQEEKQKEEQDDEQEEASVETETKEVEEVNEEASVETETKEEVEEDEDDEEIFEIDIDDKTYCTNNDENGFIWELTEDGEQGEKVGYFKESEPFFYAEEN